MPFQYVLPTDRLDKMVFSIGIFMHCIGMVFTLSGLYIRYKQVNVDGFVAYYNTFNTMLDEAIMLLEERQDSLTPTLDSLKVEFPMVFLHLDSLPFEEALLASREYLFALMSAKSELERQDEAISRIRSLNNQQWTNSCELARYYAEQNSLKEIHRRLQPLAWVFSLVGIGMYTWGFISWRTREKKEDEYLTATNEGGRSRRIPRGRPRPRRK